MEWDKKVKSEIQNFLLGWYQTTHRQLPWRKTKDPYAIWVSEVMLQQTQVTTVIPYYNRFMERFPTVKNLAGANQEQVLKLWEGLGYYARARNLHKAARVVVEQFNASIPKDKISFKSLPGVGDYIAAAVLSIAFNLPLAVVDGNVKRVLARLCTLEAPVNHSPSHRAFQEVADKLLAHSAPALFNQSVMELGALVCTPKNPRCTDCPVQNHCRALRTDTVKRFPRRRKTKPVPFHSIAVGVVKKNDKFLITRRKPEGLLGGLWEFPGGKVEKGEDTRTACVREIKEETGLDVEISSHLTRIKHAYTHFKIEMDIYLCRYISGRLKLNGPVAHQWIHPSEIQNYPFPRANLKFIPLLMNPEAMETPSQEEKK